MKKWALVSVFFLITAVSVYDYFFTTIFSITTYDIQGVDDKSKVMIQDKLQALSLKKLFGFIPNNKIFTYSSTLIVEAVHGISPDVGSIDMRPVGLHTVKIQVTTLEPLFRISDAQALNKEGIIFTTTRDIQTYPLLTFSSSTTNTIRTNGFPVTQLLYEDAPVSQDFLHILDEISTQISRIIFPVTSILVEGDDVTFFNQNGSSTVMILATMDTKKVWSTIVSAIDTEPLKGKLLSNRDGLQYLDARYGDKVFYKFDDMSSVPLGNTGATGILGSHGSTTNSTTSVQH